MRGLRFAPVPLWLRSYDWGAWRCDVVAGIAVCALVVPKVLGYAGIAQVPIVNGLYAALW